MFDMEKKKEEEINSIVSVLKQIDLPSIQLLTRDANTLLMRQQAELLRDELAAGSDKRAG